MNKCFCLLRWSIIIIIKNRKGNDRYAPIDQTCHDDWTVLWLGVCLHDFASNKSNSPFESWDSFTNFIFAVVVIVFINSWMVQSVFTNRFGSSSWTDIAFYFVDMMILLYMTNSFGNTSSENMTTFFMAASLLSLTLLLQYLIVYFKADYQADKDIAKVFSGILLFRTLTLLIGGLSNAGWARLVAFLG